MSKDKEGNKTSVFEMFGATSPATKQDNAETPQATVQLINQEQVESAVETELTEYKAFSFSKTQQPQLELRLLGNKGKWLYYPFIVPAEYDGDESITMSYQGTIYQIKGRNLKPLRHHFRTQTLDYIQVFDASLFTALPAAGEPLVEDIEVFDMGEEAE